MTIPPNYDFPLFQDQILSGDPQQLLMYLSELVYRLRFAMGDVTEAVNGYPSDFTPVVEGSTSAGTGTYETQAGIVYRIGLLSFVSIQLEWDAANHTGTGDVTIVGLPFTSAFVTDANVILTAYDAQAGSLFSGVAQISPNTTTILRVRDSDGTAAGMAADHTLTISGCYRVEPE